MDEHEIKIYDNLFLNIDIVEVYISPNSQKNDYFILSIYGIKLSY